MAQWRVSAPLAPLPAAPLARCPRACCCWKRYNRPNKASRSSLGSKNTTQSLPRNKALLKAVPNTCSRGAGRAYDHIKFRQFYVRSTELCRQCRLLYIYLLRYITTTIELLMRMWHNKSKVELRVNMNGT